MKFTTTHGLPYPEGTDSVAIQSRDLQGLALVTDAALSDVRAAAVNDALAVTYTKGQVDTKVNGLSTNVTDLTGRVGELESHSGTSVAGIVPTFADLAGLSPVDGQAFIVQDETAMYVWSDVRAEWVGPIPVQGAATEAAIADAVQRPTVLNVLTGNGEKPVGQGEQGYTVTAADAPLALDLTTALTSAATFGVPAVLKGDWPSLQASVTAPDGTVIDAHDATLTMAADFTPMFVATGSIRVHGGTFRGRATDYADAPTGGGDLRAPFIKADNGTHVHLHDADVRGFAAGALVATNCTDVRVTGNKIAGVGAGGGGGNHVFNPGVSKDNACIVINGGCTDVWITGNELSHAAQGVLGGTGNDRVTCAANHVHDIGGQHGFYFNNTTNLTVTDNILADIKAQGIKVQLSTAGGGSTGPTVITDNIGERVVGALVQLTKSASAGAAELHEHVTLGNNLAVDSGYVADIDNADHVQITGVLGEGLTAGLRLRDVTNTRVTGLSTTTTTGQGVAISGAVTSFARPTVGVTVDGFTITDPGQANSATSHFGVSTEGNVTELVVTNGTITDANAMMRYGVYLAQTSLASTTLTNVVVRGARDYGYRGTAQAVRLFNGNDILGALGAFTFPPSSGGGMHAQQATGTTAPTTGTWARGSYCWNSNPAVQGTAGSNYVVKGWVCTVAGTPGTWVEDRSLTGT